MRVLSVLMAVGLVGLSEPTWKLLRGPGSGCWPPRCDRGEIPMAIPVIAHGNRLVMLGDGAAPKHGYESDDGIDWRGFEHDARWGVRYRAADASYAGAIWRVGGLVAEDRARVLMNDVWRSVDGRRWQLVIERAPWAPRSGAHLAVLRDTLWLLGGEPNDGRLWFTTDGRSWSSREAAALPATNPQAVLVYRNALWIMGHSGGHSVANDVWTSTDGATWTQVTRRAPWPARANAGFAAFADRLWVIGGSEHRDVWSSTDGRHWQRSADSLPGPPRAMNYAVVFRNAYWTFSGKTGGRFWDGVAYLK